MDTNNLGEQQKKSANLTFNELSIRFQPFFEKKVSHSHFERNMNISEKNQRF